MFFGKPALAQKEEAFELWPGAYHEEAARTAALKQNRQAGNTES